MLNSKAGIRNIYEVTYPTPVTLEETAMGSGVKIKIKKESVRTPPPPPKKGKKTHKPFLPSTRTLLVGEQLKEKEKIRRIWRY